VTHDTRPSMPGMSVHKSGEGGHGGQRLGAFLCWAVVFADIGTSVYYVPGILYNQTGIGTLAGLFVTLTLAVFLLLIIKYAEVSVRFPEGGGVVSVAARGLHPWAGAVGGMLILTSYFLTSAISARSGVAYLTGLLPDIAPFVLLVTLLLMALLGLLNWWGIKESATVSAFFAVAALISDLLILGLIIIQVPLPIIGQVFARMFSGQGVGANTLLVGFAGAFLAFSGLESISQLAPVMRTPRRRTVSMALLLVALTVIATSPLLTIFATILLTDPALLAAAHLNSITVPMPEQFIAQLGQISGGTLLAICTAVTASTLLVFAANTAIIGAYHVFLALSRMHFFPKIIEVRNKWRDTPHVSILLATGIPMLVLLLVAGDIGVLGDLYAFGLLGAFSLTCLGLDVVRWRERRGDLHIGDTGDTSEHEERGATVRRAPRSVYSVPLLSEHLAPGTLERLWHLQRRLQPGRAVAFLKRVRRIWPDVKYGLGFLTTALVGVAWLVNLGSKPLATAFGGGLTACGVAVAAVHYRSQRAQGLAPVFLMAGLRRMPQALLVVLMPQSPHFLAVARAACATAREHEGRSLVFLYLGVAVARPIRPLAIVDPYLEDEEAQRRFAQIADLCSREHVPAQFVYRVRRPTLVQDVWRVLQTGEIIAESGLAREVAKLVVPRYVRLQPVNGALVSHLITRRVLTASGDGDNGIFMPTHAPAREWTESSRAAAGKPDEQRAAWTLGAQIDDYVWTGTELVRKDELARRETTPPPDVEQKGEQGESERTEQE